MVRYLRVASICGALLCFVLWLSALISYLKAPLHSCLSFQELESSRSPSTLELVVHSLPLPLFCQLSLVLTALSFSLFFLQLFYHDRIAHDILLEDLADAASTAPSSPLSALCSSFTHTLLLLFTSLSTLLLTALLVLGVGSLTTASDAAQHETCRAYAGVGWILIALVFVTDGMYLVLTGWRCVQRCMADDSEGGMIDTGRGGRGIGGTTAGRADGLIQKMKQLGGSGSGNGGKSKSSRAAYSAVVDDDEDGLFSADALEGADSHSLGAGEGTDGEGEGRRRGLRAAYALSGVSGYNNVPAEEEVEMLNMLDAQHRKVPSILPPPAVQPQQPEQQPLNKERSADGKKDAAGASSSSSSSGNTSRSRGGSRGGREGVRLRRHRRGGGGRRGGSRHQQAVRVTGRQPDHGAAALSVFMSYTDWGCCAACCGRQCGLLYGHGPEFDLLCLLCGDDDAAFRRHDLQAVRLVGLGRQAEDAARARTERGRGRETRCRPARTETGSCCAAAGTLDASDDPLRLAEQQEDGGQRRRGNESDGCMMTAELCAGCG